MILASAEVGLSLKDAAGDKCRSYLKRPGDKTFKIIPNIKKK